MTNETWQSIHQRGQETLAVWSTFSPAFAVGGLTFALHSTDVGALPAKSQASENQQDALDAARAARDVTAGLIRDVSVRLPRRLDGELSPSDPMHDDLADIRNIEMTGLDTILARGQRVLSVWTLVDAARAAAAPALPPVTVGGTARAAFSAALTALPLNEQTVENARSLLKERRSELRTLANKVDTNNKRWYAAWQGEFATGTPENDALSQIGTGTPTLPPTALEIDTLHEDDPVAITVGYVAGGGAHASALILQYKLPGEADFGHDTAVTQPSQEIVDNDFSNQLVTFRTKASNATGEVFSAEQSLQM